MAEMVYRPSDLKRNKTEAIYAMQGNPSQAVLIAYCAGIMDGEGTIRINKAKVRANWNYSYHAHLSLGMVDYEIPELFKEVFGGSVYTERVHGKRNIYRWNLTGRFQVVAVLKTLLPYLIVKKKRAGVVIDFCEAWKNPIRNHREWIHDPSELQRREDAYQMMRKLNLVGAGATTKRDGIREDEAIVWTDEKLSEGESKSFPRLRAVS